MYVEVLLLPVFVYLCIHARDATSLKILIACNIIVCEVHIFLSKLVKCCFLS